MRLRRSSSALERARKSRPGIRFPSEGKEEEPYVVGQDISG